MTRPRTITAVINAMLAADANANVQILRDRIFLITCSAQAYVDLKDDIDLPLISSSMTPGCSLDPPRGTLVWDRSPIPDPNKGRLKPYDLVDPEAQKRTDDVLRQEEDAANLIGGRRHPGSGSMDGLKSDGSSRVFQEESKQTAAKSFRITLEVLNKIVIEARRQAKKPMVHIRFRKIPDNMVVWQDWVVIPASIFGKMVELCGWKG